MIRPVKDGRAGTNIAKIFRGQRPRVRQNGRGPFHSPHPPQGPTDSLRVILLFTGLTLPPPPSLYEAPKRAQDERLMNRVFTLRNFLPYQKNSPITKGLSRAKAKFLSLTILAKRKRTAGQGAKRLRTRSTDPLGELSGTMCYLLEIATATRLRKLTHRNQS